MKEILASFFDPNRSMALYVIGAATLTVAITAVYEFVRDELGRVGAWGLVAALLAICFATIVLQVLRKKVVGWVGIQEELKPKPRAGLVVLVGPTMGAASHAIDYHLGTLRACWLIGSRDAMKTAEALYEKYNAKIPKILFGAGYIVDSEQVEDTYNAMLRIHDEDLTELHLTRDEVIADITGGQKPMTAGMALACLAKNIDMQYMKSQRNPDGTPKTNVPPEPLKIDTAFIPTGVIS